MSTGKLVSMWYLPIAIMRWSMFETEFVRKEWDGSSFSCEIKHVGRMWSPFYWLRALALLIVAGFMKLFTKKSFSVRDQILGELNSVTAPSRSIFGYISLNIPLPIRYVYFFVTFCIA